MEPQLPSISELPSEIVRTDQGDLAPHLTDWRGTKTGRADALLLPRNTADVIRIVEWANRHRVALVPQGGNTGLVGGSVPESFAVRPVALISMRRMDEIGMPDPASLSITVGAGAILANIHAVAENAGCRFPLSLGARGSATAGGLVSTNAGGVQVLRHGPMRSLVLGLEAVLPDGTLLDQLSALRKDNSGYAIQQLLIGAEGTLGIVTRISLKLAPPLSARTVGWAGVASADQALALLRRLRGSAGEIVESFELMAADTVELTLQHAPNLRPPLAGKPAFHVLTEIEGEPALLETVFAAAIEAGEIEDAAIAQSVQQENDFWAIRETIPEAEKRQGKAVKNDISVPVAAIPAFHRDALAMLDAGFPGARAFVFGHLGDGNLHWNIQAPEGAPESWFANEGEAARIALHDIIRRYHGSISAEHGIGTLKAAELKRLGDPGKLSAMRAVKDALDPLGILNPGKLFA